MSEYLFRRAAGDRHEARSAGSDPGTAPHPQVVEALAEIGIDASGHVPHKLDADDLAWADIAVSTCSEEVCPVTPGVRRISWVFTDPKNLPLEQVLRFGTTSETTSRSSSKNSTQSACRYERDAGEREGDAGELRPRDPFSSTKYARATSTTG